MAKLAEYLAASPDLKRLFEAGFELTIKEGHLLVAKVPYVTVEKRVARGTLAMVLSLASDTTAGKPPDHVAFFVGSLPHYADGTPIMGIVHQQGTFKLAEGVVAHFRLSSLPGTRDADYEQKVLRYVQVLSDPARVFEPDAKAQTRAITESHDDDSPFVFLDTNSARAQIVAITAKLKSLKVAIVGLGGTGSYVLDLVAKTPVKEIHLFDEDEFSLHNAYRAPGAPTREQLRARSTKVSYLAEIYSRMHKGVIPHAERIGTVNVSVLDGFQFVFLCMDVGPDKAQLVKFLVEKKIPFVDTGLGVESTSEQLIGIVNTITVTPEYQKTLEKIPVKGGGDNELYQSNIQIAELNMLNAVMAVIRWKKYFGFYRDDRHEHEASYTISPNMLLNEETRS